MKYSPFPSLVTRKLRPSAGPFISIVAAAITASLESRTAPDRELVFSWAAMTVAQKSRVETNKVILTNMRDSPSLSFSKLPTALQDERPPVVWRLPARRLDHLELCRAQRRPGRPASNEQMLIESSDLFGRSFIVNFPQGCHHAERAGIHKSPRQSHKALAVHLLAERSVASAQHDKLSWKIEVVNFMKAD